MPVIADQNCRCTLQRHVPAGRITLDHQPLEDSSFDGGSPPVTDKSLTLDTGFIQIIARLLLPGWCPSGKASRTLSLSVDLPV